MEQKNYFGRLSLTFGLAIVTILILMGSLTPAQAAEDYDFQIFAEAPSHIAMGSEYWVRLSYYNFGIHIAPDAIITALLPEGTTYLTSTDRWGDPLPPATIDGKTLSWTFTNPTCQMPADANCGHVLIALEAEDTLAEGTVLTTTATVATTGVESDTTNNTDSVASIVSEMAGSIKQVQAGLAMPGDVLTYTVVINMENQAGGGVNGRWVTLSDTLPFSHQVRFLGWHGDVTGTLIEGHTLQWQGRIEAGDPLTLQYRLGIEGGVEPGIIITNVAAIDWAGHRMRLGPATTVISHPHGTLAVGPNQAGELWHVHGISLSVPAGAVTDTTRFQAGPRFTDTQLVPIGDMLFANRAFALTASRFGEPVGHFNAPLTITAHYTHSDVVGLNRETVRLFTRSGPSGPWAHMGEPARVMSGAVAYTTTHFSEFALFAKPGDVDLDINAEAQAFVAAGGEFFVNINYANIGSAGPSDNWVTVELPEGTAFVSATNGHGEALLPNVQAGNVLTWNLEPLQPHSGREHLVLTAMADAGLAAGDLLTTVVSIDTTFEEPNKDNNETSTTSSIYTLAGSNKRVQTQHILPGDVLSYTINISLAHQLGGGINGHWVTLTDTLPFSHQIRFLGWHGDVTGTLMEDHKLRWQGQVQAGTPLTLQYRLGVEGDVAPGSIITNAAMLGWEGSPVQLGPVTTVVTMPHGMMAVGPYQAGELWHKHGVSLTVPPNAVADTTRFQIGPLFTDTQPTPPGEMIFANRAFEMTAYRFGEPVGHFNAPLTITAHYTDADVIGLNREAFRLFTRSGPAGPWAEMGEPVRVMSGAVAFTTTHFSEFALFAKPGEVDLSIDAVAPSHVAAGTAYVVNVKYANIGNAGPSDNWVTVEIPAATQFVTATDEKGNPLVPDVTVGKVMTWTLDPLAPKSGRGRIVIKLMADEGLTEGDLLTTTASIDTTFEETYTDNNHVIVASAISEMAGSGKKAQVQTAMPGDAIDYTLTVSLAHKLGGGASERWITLTDTLPFSHQVRFLGWHGGSGPITDTAYLPSHQLRWQGWLQAGESFQLKYRLGVEGDVIPGEVLTNTAMLTWDGRQLKLGPVTTMITLPHGMLGVGPYQGGNLWHRYGVSLTVPAGAVSDTTRFECHPMTDTHITPPSTLIAPPGSLKFANRAFEMKAMRFGEPVGHFNAPLTLTVHYSATDVFGIKRETLRLWTRSGPEGPWAMFGEPVGVMSGSLSFTTTHFSQFALFGEADLSINKVFLPLIMR